MHEVQTIGVTGGWVVGVVVLEVALLDESAPPAARVPAPVADEAEGVEELHPASAAAAATTTAIRMRDPTRLLATRDSVARPGHRMRAPPVPTAPTVPLRRDAGGAGKTTAASTAEGRSVSQVGRRETMEHGRAGASARAEYERRQAKDAARRRDRFGRLTPVVNLLVGPKASTEAWALGAQGEERVGALLNEVVANKGFVLHDRRVPGRRLNLDHLVVMPSGVWVIDTKHYHGRLARRRAVGWFNTREVLTVGRRNESRLVQSARQQRAIVEHALHQHVPVRAALCFTGVELGLFARAFTMDGVVITWPQALARSLSLPGVLSESARSELAGCLARAFPPYHR